MSAILLMVTGLTAFTLGYLLYSRFISERVFQLSADFQTRAPHQLWDPRSP
jgi:carbon starvation protein